MASSPTPFPTAPPPEIGGQMRPAGPSLLMAQGAARGAMGPQEPNPLEMLSMQVESLEQWASDTMQLLDVVHKPLTALLVPIAQAGKALKEQVEMLKSRQESGAPATPPPAAPPVPADMGTMAA